MLLMDDKLLDLFVVWELRDFILPRSVEKEMTGAKDAVGIKLPTGGACKRIEEIGFAIGNIRKVGRKDLRSASVYREGTAIQGLIVA